MNVNLKALIGKLNDTSRQALEGAAGLCLSRTNYNVEIEHWLLKFLEVPDTDLSRLLRHYEIDQSRLESNLTRAIDQLKTGNSRPPTLSPRIADLVREAWLLASVEFSSPKVRSGYLLLGMLDNADLSQLIRESAPELARIPVDALRREMPDITDGSAEDVEMSSAAAEEYAQPTEQRPTLGKTPALDQYTINLTLRARQGQIDPVLGRDFEIRQLVDILMRRRQNNPILTGEAGVGKTAIVEGLALRIAEGDVPPPLRNVSVRVLDLALLQAGAGVKGEFENRLKSVINEVKASPQPIVLFIDEAHTMIGAGGQAGQGDAANLLKPALARGELRTIAATTWSEYKKYFEKDAALARRFQVVKVEEPEESQAVGMLRGLVHKMEKHHKLKILDEAIEDAVRLSRRYLTGRQLPDKAVSVLDTAAARVAISHAATPPAIEDVRRRIDRCTLQAEILQRESAAGADHAERIAELTHQKQQAEQRLAELQEQWEKERDLVEQIRDIREQLETGLQEPEAQPAAATGDGGDGTAAPSPPHSAPGESPGADESDAQTQESSAPTQLTEDQARQLRERMARLNRELQQLQDDSPLMQVCVEGQTIAEVISGWTGIPVGKMLTDEIRKVATLQEQMQQRIIGQSHALQAVSRRIQTARANLVDPRRPIGVFLLVGPSGVGKTETALTLADILYGGERNMVSINMSEYQEAHTVSGLKGSPPGYVGYGEGGVLTEAVRRKPYCVVLLDEIEKAHQDVLELFYQVFDKGVLEDAEGREVDFKNTIILMTSNVGSDLIQKLSADPETRPDAETLGQSLRPELLKVFQPAFLGRLNVVPYFSLDDDVMREIIRLQLGRIADRLRENHRAEFSYDDAVVDQILDRCQEIETGARNVDHILTGTMLPEISQEVLARMAEEERIERVRVSVGADGRFAYEIE